jgi:hypothetical protein
MQIAEKKGTDRHQPVSRFAEQPMRCGKRHFWEGHMFERTSECHPLREPALALPRLCNRKLCSASFAPK